MHSGQATALFRHGWCEKAVPAVVARLPSLIVDRSPVDGTPGAPELDAVDHGAPIEQVVEGAGIARLHEVRVALPAQQLCRVEIACTARRLSIVRVAAMQQTLLV